MNKSLTLPPFFIKPILLRTALGSMDRPLPFLPFGTGFKLLFIFLDPLDRDWETRWKG